jgi:tetratricopeptide (TPR) repeat protein
VTPRATALLVAVAAGACASAAAGDLDPARLYAAGQRTEALAALSARADDARQRELAALRAMRDAGDAATGGLLRAALMLHTDRAWTMKAEALASEKPRACGIGNEEEHARSVAQLLLGRPDSRPFARRWFVAMARRSQWDLCVGDVRAWASEGLKSFPKDAELELARGMAAEAEAELGARANVVHLRDMMNASRERARIDRGLRDARESFELALAGAPEGHEARLRLGRTLWRLGQVEDAQRELSRLIAEAREPALLYLGHLFLAGLQDGLSRAADAEREYRAALAVDPGGQAAAFGLALLLSRTGDLRESRDILGRALARAPRPAPRDAYMSYHRGFAGRADLLIEGLRVDVLP